MSTLPTLNLEQARRLHLHAQALLRRAPTRARRREQLVQAIRRMHLLQIDTIHVVNRSPYLVLYARIGAFPLPWLERSLAAAELVECWAHEACFAPVADFPLHRAHQRERQHWSQRIAERSRQSHAAEIAALVARIRAEGPMRSSDFERPADAGSSAWWGWKPEKRWLEAAFAAGDLMIARRERFQRIYDVPERVLAAHPALLAAADTDPATLRAHFLLAAAQALGVSQSRWLADYFRLRGRASDAELADLAARTGLLHRVKVVGWDVPGWVHAEHLPTLHAIDTPALQATATALLSPFDPVVWDRERAQAMFGFDYRLECYTPSAKRQHGYFVLPILDRGQLIGRLDAKAHRAAGCLEVRALSLEAGVRTSTARAQRLAACLQRFADWHGTPQVQLAPGVSPALRSWLQPC